MTPELKLISRELSQDLRMLIADAKREKAHAWRRRDWCEVATSEAYINGLTAALEVVKVAIQRKV